MNIPRTCFTCIFFDWMNGDSCANGTCSRTSSMVCSKGHFEIKSYDESKLAEESILKAPNCSDYKEAK
jgi:hypothetical protein